jgi:hypothetical protein
MDKKEIENLSNSELITSLYWTAVRTTHEVNSKRGLTKKQANEETIIINECVKRFHLDPEFVKDKLDR